MRADNVAASASCLQDRLPDALVGRQLNDGSWAWSQDKRGFAAILEFQRVL